MKLQILKTSQLPATISWKSEKTGYAQKHPRIDPIGESEKSHNLVVNAII